MESFKWGQQFITGITEVDSQHQKLVSLINIFGETVAENSSSKEILLKTFQELATYAIEHFTSEEELMSLVEVDQRHVTPHLQQHADFVTNITIIFDSIDVENVDDNLMLLNYLIHWLAFHILGTDQNMAQQITDIQNSTSPADAFEKGEKNASSATTPLVTALSSLFSIISKHNTALAELNQNLEVRVQERTNDLLKANNELERISSTDHLTELPNRRFAMEQLQYHFQEAKETNTTLSCMMIDADGFKQINDTYGHDAGDNVLRILAKELQHAVRSDDVVCRLGGDEFIIICPNTNLEGALHVGEQTRKKINSLNVPAGEGYWQGSVSIGVASTTSRTKDFNDLIKESDDAVYEAKRCGRNCVKSKR